MLAAADQPHVADPSLKGKLRRRFARLVERRPVRMRLDRPIVSFAFDDAPASSAHEGARVLEAAGARATYYVSVGLCDRDGPMGRFADEAEIDALAARGHEIGCHTFTHLDCAQADAGRIERDIDCNIAALTSRGVAEPATFAYPYGEVSVPAKRLLAARYRALRGVHQGLIEDGSDLNQLPGVGIEGEDGEARAAAWIERAAARKAWLILFSHDVQPEPSPWGCTPDALSRLVAKAQAAGCEILPVASALDRIEALAARAAA